MMRHFILILSTILVSKVSIACNFLDDNTLNNTDKLMGKKSQFYHAYKQGKCVLEEALRPLPEEQREVIARLIAKTYKLEN